VRFDPRGCGLSQREVNDASLDGWVSDLEAVVDALGLQRCLVESAQIQPMYFPRAARSFDRHYQGRARW
jgi:hypothetical protein